MAAPQTVTVAWDQNPSAQQVTEYVIWVNAKEYGRTADIPNPQYDLMLEPGIYDIQVSAVNMWGESGLSDPAVTAPAVTAPINLQIRTVTTTTTTTSTTITVPPE